MKRLIVMRHAKTEPWNDGVYDRDRRLVERGHDDAGRLAIELERMGWAPDQAIVSSARRTRETWRHLSETFKSCGLLISDDLYLAGLPAIEGLVRLASSDCDTLLILGHNPGLHDFARLLLRDAGSENHRASVKLSEKFPTCAAALFAADEDSIFLPVYFKLQDFLRPKNFS